MTPLVIFSTQAWSDLWVSKHWIAHEFSRERPVLFVEPPARVAMRRRLDKQLATDVRELEVNLWALRLVTLPYPYRVPALARGVWRYPMHRQFVQALDRLGFERFDVLTFDPHCQPFVAALKARVRRTVYYAVDPPLGKEDWLWPERRLVRDSDSVLAVTHRLADLLSGESGRDDIGVLPHGIDADASLLPTDGDSVPEVFAKLNWDLPVIGYTGAIHDVCVDFSLMRKAALACPEWQFVFIGPHDGSTLDRKGFDVGYFRDCPNVFFCGAVPFGKLKYAIRMFDVCIVPYRADVSNNWERRSPFKILHYFAQGKPVVMSQVPALADYPAGLIYSYDTESTFLAAIESALAEGHNSELRVKRAALAKERSFEKLLSKLDDLF